MDGKKGFVRDFLNYYQDQLLQAFYKKRGKSIVVPNALYCIDRLLEIKKGKSKVRILDLGCGAGNLLQLIDKISKNSGFRDRLELIGVDYDEELISEAKDNNNSNIKYLVRDLRHDTFGSLKGKFDLIFCINTLHEIYTSLVRKNPSKIRVKSSKEKLESLIHLYSELLSKKGSLMIYDGIGVDNAKRDKKIRFIIKDKSLFNYFDKFIDEYRAKKLKYKKISSKIFEMKYEDFTSFISTFKYLNSKLWPIESREIYQYFSLEEFKCVFKKSSLSLEAVSVMNNDIGAWSQAVEIVSKDLDLPYKSVLLVGSKQFIPSKYDYFFSKK